MKLLSTISLLTFSFLLTITSPPEANAARVTSVKKKNVVLKLSKKEARSVKKGDRIKITDKKKKPKAIVRVVKVRGTKAYAKVLKGKVQKNYLASISSKGKSKAKKSKKKHKDNQMEKQMHAKSKEDFKKWVFGVSTGFNLLTMKINLGSEVVEATGTNFSVKGHAQYNLNSSLAADLVVGYEGFSSSGEASTTLCDSNTSTKCDSAIEYLATEVWGKWYLSRGNLPMWVGGAGAFNFPLTKSSTALQEEDIGLTNLYIVGAGVEFKLGKSSSMPVWFEYAILPTTDTVEASYLSIKLGYDF